MIYPSPLLSTQPPSPHHAACLCAMRIVMMPIGSLGEESVRLLAHEREGGGQVVVLHRAGVVVQQGQRVVRADEEVVGDAPTRGRSAGGNKGRASSIQGGHARQEVGWVKGIAGNAPASSQGSLQGMQGFWDSRVWLNRRRHVPAKSELQPASFRQTHLCSKSWTMAAK